MTDDAQFKATPAEMLERRIMDPCVSKSEAEWWARAEIERLREELYEERLTVATVVSLKAMEERLEKENDVLRRQARKASRSRDAVVRMREKLLAEVERLREALEDIARGDYSDPMCERTPEQRARAALEGKR